MLYLAAVFDADGIKALAKMPSREELSYWAQCKPLLRSLGTLNEVPSKFVRGLAAVRDQKESGFNWKFVDRIDTTLGKTFIYFLNFEFKMALSKADILEAIANMSVLELSELITEMEENSAFQLLRL